MLLNTNSYHKTIKFIYNGFTRSTKLNNTIFYNVNTYKTVFRSTANKYQSIPVKSVLISTRNYSSTNVSLQQPTTLNSSWIEKLPKSVQPYAQLSRVDKPIGVWLLLAPSLWSIVLATPVGTIPNLMVTSVFVTGAFVMRSAGCVINDMADYKFDSKVERTKSRPIAARILTHRQSLTFLAGQLSFSLGMILCTLNWYTIGLCAASIPVITLYPFMKRFTYYPQFVLGLAFNWGVLAGYSAISGSCDWMTVLPLYMAGVSWTMVYDTIYAHQDKKDDVVVGVKSTALKFGQNSGKILSYFSALTITGFALTGYMASMPPIYYLGSALCAGHLLWQLKTIDFDNPQDCLKKFKSNRDFSLLFLLTLVLSKLYLYYQQLEEKNELQS
ncbi:4-hydroxybenzoate nonaprenyltransferase [Tieghemostelium lacteum]|uniref:4-hydroxybenzoate polyprenyltransferase, mitochondrial n=1 Tax=Tieghemostelium lacteum TaxID=361077 RepID=A0A151ZHR5_TIELA|nr:4-hydroxybenzoate nonaprenyltransferase [Tieghemostelium lacteum]|eukprot:KYQ93439.1 4-hydroxybenzoate nonaprenyltransferase [Tieghemostelium lacteum]